MPILSCDDSAACDDLSPDDSFGPSKERSLGMVSRKRQAELVMFSIQGTNEIAYRRMTQIKVLSFQKPNGVSNDCQQPLK